jgi:hypothetical protein
MSKRGDRKRSSVQADTLDDGMKAEGFSKSQHHTPESPCSSRITALMAVLVLTKLKPLRRCRASLLRWRKN